MRNPLHYEYFLKSISGLRLPQNIAHCKDNETVARMLHKIMTSSAYRYTNNRAIKLSKVGNGYQSKLLAQDQTQWFTGYTELPNLPFMNSRMAKFLSIWNYSSFLGNYKETILCDYYQKAQQWKKMSLTIWLGNYGVWDLKKDLIKSGFEVVMLIKCRKIKK